MQNVLGINGQVMINLVPEAELLIGPQAPLLPLNPDEGKNRFNLVLQDFVKIFATRDHPLVICIDDMQYADPASFELIETLLTDSESGYLLLVATSQGMKSQAGQRLESMASALREAGVLFEELQLEPLQCAEIASLLADMLHCLPAECRPLAEIVQEKTMGNPYYIGQMLHQVHDEGTLSVDYRKKCWQWDLAAIKNLGMSDNIVDFLDVKIDRLNPKTRHLLQKAACIGMRFDLELLGEICGMNAQQALATLGEAMAEGLVNAAHPLYMLAKPAAAPERQFYQFSHDRIQEAAYSLLDPEASSFIHLNIGRLLLAAQDATSSNERLFEIADHFNRGMDFLEDDAEKVHIAGLNLLAGQKAKAANAYDQAARYYELGLTLLTENAWENISAWLLT